MGKAKESQLSEQLHLKEDQEPLHFLAEAGFLCLDLHRAEEAEVIFGAITTLAPNDATGFIGLGDSKRQREDLSGAIQEYDRAAKSPHADARTLAMIFRKKGEAWVLHRKPALAEKAFAKVIELDPGSDEAEAARSYVEALKRPPPA